MMARSMKRMALDTVESIYTQRITHFRRLLERTQSSSAQQLVALQAALDQERQRTAEIQRALDRVTKTRSLLPSTAASSVPTLNFGSQGFDIVSALRGDGFGGFDEDAIRGMLRVMRQADRMRLLHIVLEGCLPGDVPLMIALLERYAKTSFDIMTHLPPALSARVLAYLRLPELLTAELVSRKWLEMCRQEELYELLVRHLTRNDPVPVSEPDPPVNGAGGWRGLYHALYHRERNWAWGNPQSIKFLKGHTGFCTTLKLRGNKLLSGSYDETIRLWNIDTGEQEKCVKVKAVACIDYLVEHEVFAVGFHDIGRVQVISSLTWSTLQTLQGHLYGIRAVALSPTYMVSAGADKAIVVWEWRTGKKLVRFGQQINMCIGVQIMREDRIVSVTIDGAVRIFSISKREMISQFQLNALSIDDPIAAARLSTVGVGPNNMLQWFAANGRKMTCATKTVILHLTWADDPAPAAPSSDSVGTSPVPSALGSPSTVPPAFIGSPIGTSTPPTAASRQRRVSANASLILDNKNLKRTSLSLSTSTSLLASPTSSTPTKVGTPTTPSGSGIGMSTPSPLTMVQRRSSMLGSSTASRPSPSPRTSSLGVETLGSPSSMSNPKWQKELPTLDAVLETPDVSCGAVDPLKRRVVTSTRFSSRLGADRRMFVSTYDESRVNQNGDSANPSDDTDTTTDTDTDTSDDRDSSSSTSTPASSIAPAHALTGPLIHDLTDRPPITEITGAWSAIADEAALATPAGMEEMKLYGKSLPGGASSFKGLAVPDLNPMALALSHEKVVVGCTDGTIYVMNMVGHKFPVSAAREKGQVSSLVAGPDAELEAS
ncbi:hypothetical protein DL93DRAFT_1665994 [Clavulina sp. PMI_390]|nr:hypothetical protein DL93DRAFT_1665994 [Clavulina sp. PMI_390]